MTELLTVWLPLFLDPAAAVILIGTTLRHHTFRVTPVWHRLGLLVTACGLIAQAYRNLVYVMTGFSPSDLELPFWVLKDYGVVILAGHIIYLSWNSKRHGN